MQASKQHVPCETPRSVDSFSGCLSYCLHLRMGFDAVEVDHGGRLTAMGSVRAMVVVEGDPPPDAGSCLRSSLPGVQVVASYFRDRQSRDMSRAFLPSVRRNARGLSRQRPLPSIEIRVPTRFSRSVQANDVNWLP